MVRTAWLNSTHGKTHKGAPDPALSARQNLNTGPIKLQNGRYLEGALAIAKENELVPEMKLIDEIISRNIQA